MKIFYSYSTKNYWGVAVLFLVSKPWEVAETKNDGQGRILTLDIKIFDKELLLVNLYNANTEKNQLDTLTKPTELLNSILIQRRLDYFLISNFNRITREEKVSANLKNLCCLMMNALTN